jgi:hypothetical protein
LAIPGFDDSTTPSTGAERDLGGAEVECVLGLGMTQRIRAHFDGRVIVPDQPVDLPVNEPLEFDVRPTAPNGRGASAGGKSDLNRFSGSISLGEDPLDYQRRVRDEWR